MCITRFCLVNFAADCTIAGTMRHADIRLGLPASSFPLKAQQPKYPSEISAAALHVPRNLTNGRRNIDEFDDGIDEVDMVVVGRCCMIFIYES